VGTLSLPACATAQLAPRGRLAPVGLLEIDTAPWGAGGFSGLHLAPNLTLTAISDRGFWWQARLALGPMRLGPARHGPLRNATGQPLATTGRDAEALVGLPDGSWLVGFERRHRKPRNSEKSRSSTRAPEPSATASVGEKPGAER